MSLFFLLIALPRVLESLRPLILSATLGETEGLPQTNTKPKCRLNIILHVIVQPDVEQI